MNMQASGRTAQLSEDGWDEYGSSERDLKAESATGNGEERARKLMWETVATAVFQGLGRNVGQNDG
jgi:hypothetical protein